MKVALVTYLSPSIVGGVATVARDLIKCLGNKVNLSVVCEKGALEQSTIKRCEIPQINLPHGSFLACHVFVKRLVNAIKEIDPDVVHANYAQMLLYASRLIKRRYRLVATAHASPYRELETLILSRSFLSISWDTFATLSLYPYWHLGDRSVLQDSHLIIAASRAVRSDIFRTYGITDRVVVIPNGVDTEYFVPAASNEAGYVLFVGRLVHGKGAAQIIKAMAIIAKRHLSISLHIAGDGPLRNSLAHLASSLGIASKVAFLGHLGRRDLLKEYQHCTLFALPALYGWLGLAPLEAMSCGKPVAMPHSPELNHFAELKDCFIPIDPSDPVSIAEKLCMALDEKEELVKMGKIARTICTQHFGLEAFSKRMIDAYKLAIS